MKSSNRVVDPILTQFGMEYRQLQSNYVADKVAPWVQTQGDTGTYYIADALNNLAVENAAWSYTTGANRVDSVYTSAAFAAQPYALEEVVPDAYVRNWLAGGDDLKRRTVSSLMDRLLLQREWRVGNGIFDAVAPTTSLTTTAWDNTSANPRADVVATMGATIMKRIGRMPNALVIGQGVWLSIAGTALAGTAGGLIIDAIKYTQKGMGSAITPDLVAQYLNLDYVFPALAIRNATTDIETTTANASGLAVAGVSCFNRREIYAIYVDPNPGPQTTSYLTTFGPTKGEVDQYRDDRVMADVIRITETLVEKTTCSNAIYTLGTVVT